MYDIYNDSNELIAKNLTDDQLIAFANDEFAETDNIDDARKSLEAFGYTIK